MHTTSHARRPIPTPLVRVSDDYVQLECLTPPCLGVGCPCRGECATYHAIELPHTSVRGLCKDREAFVRFVVVVAA